MPIFEYFCTKCHKEFEELVFGEELPSCIYCGASKCQKLISRPCVQRNGLTTENSTTPITTSSSKCSGCSGGNCSTCH